MTPNTKRIELPSLPYAYNALAPVISEEIMTLHHTRHHLAYVTGANAALDKLEKSRTVDGYELDYKATLRDLSFHLGGHKLHNLFWQNLRPSRDNNQPGEVVQAKLAANFGSYAAFVKEFSAAAKAVEGSGWAILAESDGFLHVLQLQNQNLLGVADSRIILALDVWEHAYYLDYKNDRGAYVDKWWSIVNWDEVATRLG